MTFITILIALIIERFLHWSHLRHWQWYSRYQYFLSVRIGNWPNNLLLLACVVPPAIVAGLIGCILSGWFYDIPKLLFSIVVLLYCLGPNNLWVQIYTCIRGLHKDDPLAAVQQVKTMFGINSVDQPQAFHQAFIRAIFIAANQRIFAVLFWFAILGPFGAVLYRAINLSSLNTNLGITSAANNWQRILDWLPARLFTFIFALGGHFTKVFTYWKRYVRQGLNSNDEMLGNCGIAALDVAEGDHLPEDGVAENETLELLDRVFVMGLVILAVIVFVT